jgi:hypothetical protein
MTLLMKAPEIQVSKNMDGTRKGTEPKPESEPRPDKGQTDD